MTIIFESYTVNDGAGSARLPFAVRGLAANNTGAVKLDLSVIGEGIQSNDGSGHIHFSPLVVRGASTADGFGHVQLPFSVQGSSNTLAPDIAIGLVSLPEFAVMGEGSQANDGEGIMTLPLRLLASDAAGFGHVNMPLAVYGSDGHVSTDRIALLVQQPVLIASMVRGITVSLADEFASGDDATPDFIHALMDLIRFSDRYSQAAQVLQALADGVALADVAQMIIQADLLDSFIASGVLAGTAQITVMLADEFVGSDGASALSEILAALHDGFYATITVNTGEDAFTAWVMTPQTKAMRSYSNWAFNSYAVLGGQFIGAGPAGIYRMGGTSDAGAAIRAAIRSGKLDFGSMAMKGAPLVYVGATTSGDLLLKVQATTVRGQMVEQTYRMTPAVTGEPREHRLPIGRGFRSIYWTFELTNDTDGAAFEVHEWHAVPVQHTGKLI